MQCRAQERFSSCFAGPMAAFWEGMQGLRPCERSCDPGGIGMIGEEPCGIRFSVS